MKPKPTQQPIHMKKFEVSKTFTELELYNFFGKYAKYVHAGRFYYLHFMDKDLSADSPKELFEKFKAYYKTYQDS